MFRSSRPRMMLRAGVFAGINQFCLDRNGTSALQLLQAWLKQVEYAACTKQSLQNMALPAFTSWTGTPGTRITCSVKLVGNCLPWMMLGNSGGAQDNLLLLRLQVRRSDIMYVAFLILKSSPCNRNGLQPTSDGMASNQAPRPFGPCNVI